MMKKLVLTLMAALALVSASSCKGKVDPVGTWYCPENNVLQYLSGKAATGNSVQMKAYLQQSWVKKKGKNPNICLHLSIFCTIIEL